MKKLLLLCATVLFSLTIIAQELVQKNAQALTSKQEFKMPSQAKNFVFDGKNFVRTNPITAPAGVWHYVSSVVENDATSVGLSNYDLQSNSGARTAIIQHSQNSVSLIFTQYHGTNLPNAPERGTGYAYFNGTDWLLNDQASNERVEGTTRTGWGSLLSNGTEEMVVSHGSTNGLYGRYQNIGTAVKNWATRNVSGVASGLWWPRTASVGSNYYVVGCSGSAVPYGFKFGKSTDAGQNWTFTDLPDFSSLYYTASGDSYSIDAKDNIVAIVFFGEWGDITLWKSTDYGQNFTRTTIADFPVDAYNPTVGPIIDIDNNSTADTLITSDGCGDLVIDKDGTIHVVFGRMRVLDDAIDSQGGTSYFPYTDWILYWNDKMPAGQFNGSVTDISFVDLQVADEVDTVAWFIDFNNDGQYNLPSGTADLPFGKYYCALTSQPTLGTDDFGNLFLAYTMLMEGTQYTKSDATPNAQNYRFLWFRYRTPWGEWSDFNVLDLEGNAEYAFPDMVPHVKSDSIWLWIQWDGEPGLNIRGDGDAATDNYILAKSIDLIYADSTFVSTNTISSINASVVPNPVKDVVTITSNSKCNYTILDINGREVLAGRMENQTQNVNLEKLQRGVYFVRLSNEQGTTTKKIIKQ